MKLATVLDVASVIFAAINQYRMVTGEGARPATEEAVAGYGRGVKKAWAGDRPLTAAELHEAWIKDRVARGWAYGPVYDHDAKTNPAMVPWDELPESQRAKGVIFSQMAHLLAPSGPVRTALAAGEPAPAPADDFDPPAADPLATEGATPPTAPDDVIAPAADPAPVKPKGKGKGKGDDPLDF